jgi:hypothetical protein
MDRPGFWTHACLAVVVALALSSDLARFKDPVGEKYVSMLGTGGADFALGYLGARAFVKGADPYLHDRPRFADPYARDFDVEGTPVAHVFLPTHVLMHAPLAMAAGPNIRRAGRIWFHVSVAALLALALVVALIVREMHPASSAQTPLLAAVVALVLGLNTGTQLGFERGQSDLFTSLLCWTGVLLTVRGRPAPGLALVTAAALLKGYASLATALLLLVLPRKERGRALGGLAAAVLLLLGPVVQYLPIALAVARERSNDFSSTWVNHGFQNLVYHVRPEWAAPGRLVLVAAALLVAMASAWRARPAFESGRARAFRGTLVALVGLVAVIGYSGLSNAYNIVLVTPGVLALALAQQGWVADMGLSAKARNGVGCALAVTAALFWLPRIGTSNFPMAGLGLLAVVALGAWLAFGTSQSPLEPPGGIAPAS